MGAVPRLLRVAISPRKDSFLKATVRGSKQTAVQEDQATTEGTKEVQRGSSSAQGRLDRLLGDGLKCWVLKAKWEFSR